MVLSATVCNRKKYARTCTRSCREVCASNMQIFALSLILGNVINYDACTFIGDRAKNWSNTTDGLSVCGQLFH